MAIEIQREGNHTPKEEQRFLRRSRVLVACSFRERSRSAVDARISDLNERGCRLESPLMPMPGSHIWVRLPGLESQGALVVWSSGSNVGIEFEQALHPAVARRFTGEDSAIYQQSMPLAGAPGLAVRGLDDPLLSRREQIMMGAAANDHSPLTRRKKPKNGGIMAAISRQVLRTVDHRKTDRFTDFTSTGEVNLTIADRPARPLDISSNGLRAGIDFDVNIGTTMPLVIEGFDPIPGRVVWVRGGEAGFVLPEDSFDLQAN